MKEGRHLPVSLGLPPFSEKLAFLNDVFNLKKNVSNSGQDKQYIPIGHISLCKL